MSDLVLIAIITGLPPTIFAITASYISLQNHKTLIKQDKKLEEIHQCVDKIMK